MITYLGRICENRWGTFAVDGYEWQVCCFIHLFISIMIEFLVQITAESDILKSHSMYEILVWLKRQLEFKKFYHLLLYVINVIFLFLIFFRLNWRPKVDVFSLLNAPFIRMGLFEYNMIENQMLMVEISRNQNPKILFLFTYYCGSFLLIFTDLTQSD